MGKVKTGLFGLAAAAATGIAGEVYTACPNLHGRLTAILLAGLAGALTMWMARPQKLAGLKATATGLATAAGTAAAMKLTAVCPELLPQLPGLMSAGFMAGLGLWLRSPKEEAPDEYVKPRLEG